MPARRAFRDPTAPAHAPRFFCAPCAAYHPPTAFYPASIADSSAACIPCARAAARQRRAAARAQDPVLFDILNATRVRASRAASTKARRVSRTPARPDAARAVDFWARRSAVSAATAHLVLVPADPAAPFTAANAVLLTTAEAAAHAALSDLPAAVRARLPDLAQYVHA